MPGPRRQAVIVGAGPAGDGVAAGMRDAGFAGDIKLIGAEPEPPYERPHLSKGYLLGTVPWDVVCIATGSDARSLPGVDGATYLRELPAAMQLRERVERGESLRILGAGFIGCEVASAARQNGCKVALHEALEQPLLRVLG